MENGTGIAVDAKLDERNGGNTEETEPSIKENVHLSLDGSKGSDDEEVFEEAVEAKTPTTGSEITIITKEESSEFIGTLGNDEGNPDEFHEAVATPTIFCSEDPRVKSEILMSEKNHDDKEIAIEKIVRAESNGLIDEIIDENNGNDIADEKDDYKEIVESAAIAGETENLDDRNEKSEKSNKEPEDGVSEKKMSFLEALISGETKLAADADNREELDLKKPETSEDNELIRAETDPEKLEVVKFPDMTTEIQSDNIVGGDTASCNPENGTADHEDLVGTLDYECRRSESADVLEDHMQETSVEIEDLNGEKGSEAHIRTNMRLTQVDLESTQCDKVDTQHADQKENISTSPSDASATDHGVEINLHSVVDDSNLVKEIAEVDPQSSLPELLGKGSSNSQPNLTDFGAEVSTKINESPEPGKKKDEKPEVSLSENKDEKQEASLSGNKQQEVRPGTGISSSSGNSSTAGLSPAHPASVKDAAKVQEPVSQDTTAKATQQTKPAADISSSAKSVTTRSTGVGLNAALLEPTSQNTNSRSRSVADTPTNTNSATPARPAGLGRAAPLLEPSSRVVQQPRANGAVSATQNQLIEDPTNGEAEEYDETREKLQMIRVKFLRLAHRLGQTPHNVVVAQVLYRLGLAEQLHGRSGGRVGTFSFDRASAMAEQLEAAGQEPLDFTCTIMVLGKSGVGKSATINSIFDEGFFGTDAFELGTKKVQDIVGTVQGIRVRVVDTPGLLPSWSDQRDNEKILRSVKKFIKKTPPDIVLYLDRLDMQSRDFGDMPLLRTITDTFGPSIWFNAIVVLTHAASAPPEGPNGTATSYDMFVTQRSHVVQQAIRQAAGDMRLMNPVSLVENHSACRTNRAGQRVLPNGQVWKPHLLLLSFASKILAEANTLLKLQDTPPGRPFAPRTRSPPLPFLLSSILQSRPEVKLPSEQYGDDDDDDIVDDLEECSDSEEESEYDELPPFKPLTKAQLEKLSKVQRKGYYDELEYREKLFMKKQLKEERKRRKMMKKMQEAAKNMPADYGDNGEEESSAAASVPVPMPDLALPASFDSDNPTHRYRSLDSSNPWLVRAVLEPNGWDHDIGYDGINVERLFVVKEKMPISFSGHISKDKKDANVQMEIASSVKHGKGKATSLGFDMQPVGKDYAYTLRSETRFSNHRINKAAAGLSATVLGDVLTGGLKLEDKLIIGKRGQIVVSGGAIYGRGEVAYGGSLEATLRDKDHPLGRFLSTFGLSVMDWHGDVAIGCNSQTQIPIGRHTNLIGRFNINNRGSGQFSIKINSTEQLQIVLVGLVPLVKKILGYSQQVQYG
ncbi:translocon outer complex protein 120 [Perilla frutescens var. hirtella]|uniref:Translocon outer complex protein 120 n=1 Tax=Perilla frutescens var. hirtella TaxID=608512 RepID=A0AAD4IP10_PERFH|nr:translocon outer complex protein 120 [Perilla frutescens var. hirtella]